MTGVFTAESTRILRVDVSGGVWIKPGAAIAYTGAFRFERQATADAPSAQEAIFRELAPLVRAIGHGRLFCADHGSHVRIVHVDHEPFVVAGPHVLAFDEALAFDRRLLGHGLGIAAGGLIVTTFSGSGAVALAVHGECLGCAVTPGHAVCTDPHATVAWSGGLEPQLKTDLSWRSALAHGGQQAVQMRFEGTGTVWVQPFKDPGRWTMTNALSDVAKVVTA